MYESIIFLSPANGGYLSLPSAMPSFYIECNEVTINVQSVYNNIRSITNKSKITLLLYGDSHYTAIVYNIYR